MQSKLKAMQTQCNFYGAQAWCLSDATGKTFYSTCNHCISRIMNLPYKTRTRFLPELSGIPHAKDSIACRIMNLYVTMWSCDIEYVNFIAKKGIHCGQSIIGNNLRLLSRKYRVTFDTLGHIKLQSNMLNVHLIMCSNEDMVAIQAITDMNSKTIPDFFTEEDFHILLNDLCDL